MMWADSKYYKFILETITSYIEIFHFLLDQVLSLSRDLAGGRSSCLVENASDSCLSRRVPRTDSHVRLCFLSSDPGFLTLDFCQGGLDYEGKVVFIITFGTRVRGWCLFIDTRCRSIVNTVQFSLQILSRKRALPRWLNHRIVLIKVLIGAWGQSSTIQRKASQ